MRGDNAFTVATTEDATLGPKPKCAIVGAKIKRFVKQPVPVTRNAEPLHAQFEVDHGRGGASLEATVVEDFK